jgi:hypothetical protein
MASDTQDESITLDLEYDDLRTLVYAVGQVRNDERDNVNAREQRRRVKLHRRLKEVSQDAE